jgi:hypothetical protein
MWKWIFKVVWRWGFAVSRRGFTVSSDVIINTSSFFQRNITMTINHLMMNHRTQLLLPNLDMVLISGLHLRDLVALMESIIKSMSIMQYEHGVFMIEMLSG